jgi:hypothetical protein
MPGFTTNGYNQFVSPAEAERLRRVAAELGDVTIKGEVGKDGGMVWVSRTAADEKRFADFQAKLAAAEVRTFEPVTAPANTPSISELQLAHEPTEQLATTK